MVFIILYTLYVIIIGLLSIDLQIQFLTETKKYEIDEPKEDDDFQEEDFQEDEYLEDYYDYPENEE